MIRAFEGFDDIPRLSFHNGDLSREHSLLEVGVSHEALAQGGLGLSPPRFGREKREEVVSGFLAERLADQGRRQKPPSIGIASPLLY
jgi:hypothetical protein